MKKHVAAMAVVFGLAAGARGQDVNQKVDDLQKQIDALKAQVQQAAPAPAKNAVEATYDDGYVLKAADASLKIGGYFQADGRAVSSGSPGDDSFLVRRARLDLRGQAHGNFGGDIQYDFSNSPKMIYAWAEYNEFTQLRLRVGQQKVPFAMEDAVVSAACINFVERSMVVTAFAPTEDVGAMLYGSVMDKKLEYSLGAFNGRGKNVDDNNDDKDIAGRVVISPVQGLYWGVNGTYGTVNDKLTDSQPSLKTDGKTAFYTFASDAREDGDRTRIGTDLAWYAGPGSVEAEWIKADLDGLSSSNGTADASFDGWYVGGTYLVTGEQKQRSKLVEPSHPFSLKSGGAGAWELAARYQVLTGDQDLLDSKIAKGADEADGILAGVNWYPNHNVKITLDYEHVTFSDDVTVDGKTFDSEEIGMMRFQYSL